ncbi:class II D-tagatose-bisphosphate aldolase, non-catalytic subunit [Candidatus Pacearchaeota archaeon]|nr:class II D-tagatose-bisphosphate aldolase, non-catalytic subunit [Candidatus Pacearchaeota archaeon]
MIKSNLGVGPMSSEVIEAIFRSSHYQRKQLMIIASKNQIDYEGGYVNNWTTKEFMEFVYKMKKSYPNSDVKICRDHCGPGFNGNHELSDVYKTIKTDIDNGFDLIHIDFCHFKGSKDEALEESKKAIEYCLKLNPNILLEIGTDENQGTNFGIMNLNELEREINFFKNFCNPEFYVVQTGSLVKEINQVGNFNKEFVEKISEILTKKGLKLKEHNADYLSKENIKKRSGIVDALNIAPQLGVIQTAITLQKCLVYGVDFSKFSEVVYKKGKWKKWLYENSAENKFLCTIIAGHYHFASEEYKNIMEELGKREDIKENIISEIMEVIDHYG